jgi:hypothetical protein
MIEERFQTFSDFYPFYLQEHRNRTSRILHVFGTGIVLLELITLIVVQASGWYWFVLPLTGYGFAWVGHFFFEKNRPATFQYPLWSLRGDFTLFFDVCTRKRGFDAQKDPESSSSSAT